MNVSSTGETLPGETALEGAAVIAVLLDVVDHLRLRLADFLGRFDLTEGRYSVLEILLSRAPGGISQCEVASQLGQSESNISSHVDRLQRDGLVDRSWSLQDRRKRVLMLTEAGRVLTERVTQAHRDWANLILERLEMPGRTALLNSLRSLSMRTPTPPSLSIPALPVPPLPVPDLPVPPLAAAASRRPLTPRETPLTPASPPQLALQEMLSQLGLTRRIAGDLK